ncbi:MAG: nucleotidyltransferase domain-containing protein [Candidatus Nezhaarchaeota archaeon]|nr:nucleotidyltransferase domain-containing protein [Candidatus Nezhaarchaeota archaeon]MCX8142041.1 nucleotidyltransferase domain-containing protein [Candidatus Nezhaarchaeota archaeon]MDW8050178.1 nucleotidyltransferase domain-containing protein [Nitrososphaerota archaeon]
MSKRKKPVKVGDRIEVIYSDGHWRLLFELRKKAVEIMENLKRMGLNPIIHGSVARGDVSPRSDVDVVIPYLVPSYRIELLLSELGVRPLKRMITQATPAHSVKAHIYLDEATIITIPLTELTRHEREFYKFGGELSLEELKNDKRVCGIDKRLKLIEPSPRGHYEEPIIGRELYAANKVGVSLDVVYERIKVLTRRDEVGRTGVYLKYEVGPNESIEGALMRLASKDPALRRVLASRGFL